MSKEKILTCPGCHKHCKENAPRCKYGQSYFAKQKKKAAAKGIEDGRPIPQKHCKWERYVEKEGPAWKMLMLSRKIKKDLCHQKITEEQLFSCLSDTEKQIFSYLLDKLSE